MPSPQDLARTAIQPKNWAVATVKDEDVIVGIHGDARNLSEGEPLGQLRPSVHHLIDIRRSPELCM
jgi:hypothetical protein